MANYYHRKPQTEESEGNKHFNMAQYYYINHKELLNTAKAIQTRYDEKEKSVWRKTRV